MTIVMNGRKKGSRKKICICHLLHTESLNSNQTATEEAV